MDNILKSCGAGQRLLILDGASGTRLAARWGGDGPVEELNVTDPTLVRSVHVEYLEAGCDILTTNSFNLINRTDTTEADLAELAIASIRAAEAAITAHGRKSADHQIIIAGSLGPFSGDDSDWAVERRYRLAAALMTAGADILLLETQTNIASTIAALDAIGMLERDTGAAIPIWVSAVISADGRLLRSGEPLAELVDAVIPYGPLILGINCVSDMEAMAPHLQLLGDRYDGYVSFHPSAGIPVDGIYPISPELFVDSLRPLAESGLVDILGGCCGTTPEHIGALRAEIGEFRPRSAFRQEL